MEVSRNPNFYGIGGEDEDYRRFGSSRFLPHHRSISEQNHIAPESEYIRRQHSGNMDCRHQFLSSGGAYYSNSAGTGTVQMWQQQSCLVQYADISSAAESRSRIYSRNVTAGETELMRQQQLDQHQHEDTSSVDSYSRRKIPAITEERKPRKREANRAHKEDLETLQAEIGQLKIENYNLRQENARQRQQFDDLKKKYEERHEVLEAENRKLKDKYIELLEKSNPLVDPRFGTHPIELGQQRVQSFSRASACGSVTGHPTNAF